MQRYAVFRRLLAAALAPAISRRQFDTEALDPAPERCLVDAQLPRRSLPVPAVLLDISQQWLCSLVPFFFSPFPS